MGESILMETSKSSLPIGCTTRTAWFDGSRASWLLPPGTVSVRCAFSTEAVPPLGATTAHNGPGKLLDIGAPGSEAGVPPLAGCVASTMASEETRTPIHSLLFRSITIASARSAFSGHHHPLVTTAAITIAVHYWSFDGNHFS